MLRFVIAACTNCFAPPAESSVSPVEGPRTEQSEQILQGLPLLGPVGTSHQPAGSMKTFGISTVFFCTQGGKKRNKKTHQHRACVIWEAPSPPPSVLLSQLLKEHLES